MNIINVLQLGAAVSIPSAVLALSAAIGSSQMIELPRVDQRIMATRYCITFSEQATDTLADEIVKTLNLVNNTRSDWRTTSELSHFNESFCSEWQPLTSGTIANVNNAAQISKISHGAFDIFIAPLEDAPQTLLRAGQS